jgi:hypothetical protein
LALDNFLNSFTDVLTQIDRPLTDPSRLTAIATSFATYTAHVEGFEKLFKNFQNPSAVTQFAENPLNVDFKIARAYIATYLSALKSNKDSSELKIFLEDRNIVQGFTDAVITFIDASKRIG